MTTFFRFPRTPHLAWLGANAPRGDKVLSRAEASALLSGEVVVEEKIDGANIGFSVDHEGHLRAQNRGNYLDVAALTGQWKPLRRWLATRQEAIEAALFPNLILFGEWCYAVHSVRYTRLPDWFLAFDVYDRSRAEFWSVARRNDLAGRLHMAVTPQLARGHLSIGDLKALLSRSTLTDGPPEGVYVRREGNGRLIERAKLVRAEFVQAIGEHWSKRRLEPNRLVGETP